MATSSVKPVPEGYNTITPSICVRDAAQAIDFYKKAFGAEERMRMPSPDGKILHAELKIGDSILFLSDEIPGMCTAPGEGHMPTTSLYVYLPDVDAVMKNAEAAGAKILMPAQDMFWGDRNGSLEDPFGHRWAISTHVEDVAPEEMEKRQAAFFAKAAGAGHS